MNISILSWSSLFGGFAVLHPSKSGEEMFNSQRCIHNLSTFSEIHTSGMWRDVHSSKIIFFASLNHSLLWITGTPPLTRFFGPRKNRVKGKPRYRRSILVLKPLNREFENLRSTSSLLFTSVKLQLQSLHLYL